MVPIVFIIGCFAIIAVWSCFEREARPELLLSGIGAVGGLTYFLYRQHLDETKLFNELFVGFNKRYDDLKDKLHAICEEQSSDLSAQEKDELFRYFNLCSEEYLFYKSGYIDEEVWKSWRKGMDLFLKHPRVAPLWQNESRNGSYYGFPLA